MSGCLVPGCTQVIVEEDRIQVNTFLKDIDFDKLNYSDLAIERYSGQSKDVKATYSPITGLGVEAG